MIDVRICLLNSFFQAELDEVNISFLLPFKGGQSLNHLGHFLVKWVYQKYSTFERLT